MTKTNLLEQVNSQLDRVNDKIDYAINNKQTWTELSKEHTLLVELIKHLS